MKIGDFGLAVEYHGERVEKGNLKKKTSKIITNCMLSKKVGTPFYLSPEQREEKQYDEKVDIYSIGLILFDLCSNFKTVHSKVNAYKDLRERKKIS